MSKIYGKTDLVADIAARTELSRASVEAVLQELANAVHTETEAGRTVVLPGVGRFTQKMRAARAGRNPRTGAPVDIPAKAVLGFKPSKATS
ncbi:HU family DNA-binding protein [Rhodobacter sp. NTK016B]|uniref:HU family DNA-binding protein n=1 Tax=Rhodobacter sp. NTK016B TaxID=2759676 RepID=UPI001A8C7E85|nr:HU family DNA-binding protein [Rhodobacter sp. NTK016B]MBN8294714.1 HU family DNA-binding protein [Rhodobacter sp. NTK016B]